MGGRISDSAVGWDFPSSCGGFSLPEMRFRPFCGVPFACIFFRSNQLPTVSSTYLPIGWFLHTVLPTIMSSRVPFFSLALYVLQGPFQPAGSFEETLCRLYHACVRVYYLLRYRGELSIDFPAQGNACNTLPPSERRDLFGASVPYAAVHKPPPASFQYLENQGDMFSETHAQQAFPKKETFEARLEPVSCRRRQM